MLLAEVLSPVTRNRDHDAGFVAEAPMTRSLAGEFGKAVIDKPGHERSAGDRAHRRIVGRARRKPGPRLTIAFILSAPLSRPSWSLIGTPGPVINLVVPAWTVNGPLTDPAPGSRRRSSPPQGQIYSGRYRCPSLHNKDIFKLPPLAISPGLGRHVPRMALTEGGWGTAQPAGARRSRRGRRSPLNARRDVERAQPGRGFGGTRRSPPRPRCPACRPRELGRIPTLHTPRDTRVDSGGQATRNSEQANRRYGREGSCQRSRQPMARPQ